MGHQLHRATQVRRSRQSASAGGARVSDAEMRRRTTDHPSWSSSLCVLGLLLHFAQRSQQSIVKPRDGDPFDSFPKNFWQEFSSPFTDAPSVEEHDAMTDSTTHEPQPWFEETAGAVNVTTHLGTSVFLHCRVNDLSGKTVSWVRRRGDELNLITFGRHTYSSDSRYSLVYQTPNNWQLHIQYANERDEGHYECQVSVHPPLVLQVYLHVVVPFIAIDDDRGVSTPEKFYRVGSTIELKCIIDKIPHRTSYVMWKHGQRMLNYDTSRGGISVKTDLQTGRAVSHLFIANANRHDSGNYSCTLGDFAKAVVMVHVLNGENPAAMQHAAGKRWSPAFSTVSALAALLIILYQCSNPSSVCASTVSLIPGRRRRRLRR